MGMHFDGDAAYQVSDVMLLPFTVSQHEDQEMDAFNFFLLQQCICIAIAFGLLQTQCCVLNKLLHVSLSIAAKVIETCARLQILVLAKTSILALTSMM